MKSIDRNEPETLVHVFLQCPFKNLLGGIPLLPPIRDQAFNEEMVCLLSG